MDVRIQVIGFVRNEWSEAQPFEANKIMQSISTIEVKEAFADGLFKIENQSELQILWHFHQSRVMSFKPIHVRVIFGVCLLVARLAGQVPSDLHALNCYDAMAIDFS
jgi:hypothetical protein